jgi:hypothetical protein
MQFTGVPSSPCWEEGGDNEIAWRPDSQTDGVSSSEQVLALGPSTEAGRARGDLTVRLDGGVARPSPNRRGLKTHPSRFPAA